MKKNIFLLSSVLTMSLLASAQTEVTVGVTQGKDYGVTYMLPQTEIEIKVHTTKHTYTPGEFCRYADRYLRLSGVSDEPEVYWTIDKIETGVIGVPDKDNVYFVKMKDKTVAPLMELTENGIVRSINLPFSGKKEMHEEYGGGLFAAPLSGKMPTEFNRIFSRVSQAGFGSGRT